jgi:EAL domain-containing protein (putative c-di-GMP-specific phosphodiesterase class I)/GGDEF domain-containing protein
MSSAQGLPETSRYRSRYLKLKSVLHDRATGYPAVAVLLDQLRTQLDGRKALGVLHVAIENLALIESLYGWQVLDRVLCKVALEIRESCGEELPKETLLAINAVAGDSFAAFVIERTDGREVDAESMRASGDALRGRIEAALGDDEFTGLGPKLTVRVGHALLSRNPFYRFERRVYAALNEAATWETDQKQRRERNLTHELQSIIQEDKIETVFQPVVDLRSHAVLGYEALSRGPADTPLERPQAMFRASAEVGISTDLDRTCREAALRAMRGIATPGKVFLNALPNALAGDEAQQLEMLETLHQVALAPHDLVLEFSERESQQNPEDFVDCLAQLKSRGFGIALDDIGTGYVSQAVLEQVRPDYLKLDISLVRGIEENLIKQELIASLIRISAKIGASVIAEGVETHLEAQTLIDAGAQFGQGHLFAAPAPPGTIVVSPRPGQEH